jgi:outer membrane protein assembly factor BamB
MPRAWYWLIVAYVTGTMLASAADWPQWMGPNRDDVWREAGLLSAFPKQGLKVLWRVPVGGGYAGPAVADGRVFVTDFTPKPSSQRPDNPFQRISQPGTERVTCIDQKTGRL